VPRPDRRRNLRIDAEPETWLVEMALEGRPSSSGASRAASSTTHRDAIKQQVRAMLDAARELESRVRKVGGDLHVEAASVAIMYAELAGFVVCHGRVNLDQVRDDRGPAWWHVVDMLRALDQLKGYAVRISLGGRACTIAEAIAEVAPPGGAARGPSTDEVEAYTRRARLERQKKEPPRPRSRGKEPPYGSGSAGRSAGSAYGASRSSAGPSHSHAGARAAPPRSPPPPRQPPPPPRPAGPAEFFLARTGLQRPFDLAALKKAFRRGVKGLHPDHRPGDQHAHDEFCRFKEGYDELEAEVSRPKPATR
jgi:hypothetical protein